MTGHRLDALIAPHLDTLVGIRRDLHAHPELGYEEHRTAELVERHLRDLGLAPKRPVETGLIADTGEGPALALRADLDALPLEEQTGAGYASTVEGRMHACGHDGHTTVLLGTAMALASVRDQLPGNVRLLFQPAEEGLAGAQAMIGGGALEGVERIFGLHNWPLLPLGKLAVKPGPLMASASSFEVTIRGQGGHGSMPWDAADPVLPAAHFVTQLQSIVARETPYATPATVSACRIQAGTAINIIPEQALVSGTVRTFDDEQARAIGQAIARIADGAAAAGRCTAETEFRTYYPVTVNHEAEAALVAEVGAELFGAAAVTDEGLPMGGAEDFSFYLQQRPGAFFFLGGGVEGGRNAPCHSAYYDFNDDLILRGVRTWLRIVERALGCELVPAGGADRRAPGAVGGGGVTAPTPGDPSERNLGEQPLARRMAERGLKPSDLVAASTEQITHKMVTRALKGRRLTANTMGKVHRAWNRAAGTDHALADLFDYEP